MNQVRFFAVVALCSWALSVYASDGDLQSNRALVEELKKLSAERLHAYNTFDTDRFIAFHWADDEFVYAREGKIIQGIDKWSEAVRAGHKSFAEVRVSVVVEDIVILGSDAAVITQVFDITGLKHSGDRYIGRGTQTLVWSRRGNKWVVVNLAETKSKDYGER